MIRHLPDHEQQGAFQNKLIGIRREGQAIEQAFNGIPAKQQVKRIARVKADVE